MIQTIYPNVIPLSDLFDGFEMAKMTTAPQGGSRTNQTPGFLFVGGPTAIKSAKVLEGVYLVPRAFYLYGKPKQEMLDVLTPRCCAGNVSSFRLTQQCNSDIYLLTATDRTSIPSIPVAWIHRDTIPDLEVPAK